MHLYSIARSMLKFQKDTTTVQFFIYDNFRNIETSINDSWRTKSLGKICFICKAKVRTKSSGSKNYFLSFSFYLLSQTDVIPSVWSVNFTISSLSFSLVTTLFLDIFVVSLWTRLCFRARILSSYFLFTLFPFFRFRLFSFQPSKSSVDEAR